MAATRTRHCFELLDETSDPALLRAVEQSTLPDPVLDEGGMREREREGNHHLPPYRHRQKRKMPKSPPRFGNNSLIRRNKKETTFEKKKKKKGPARYRNWKPSRSRE